MQLFDDADPVSGFPALAALPWHERPALAYRTAGDLLRMPGPLREVAADWLRSLDPGRLEYLLDRSTERNTHVKWCLGGARRDYLVWLHQYKSAQEFAGADAFAASVHDHRYGFVSRVLSGRLDVTWFAPQPTGMPVPRSRQRLRPGDVVALTPDDIHRIDAVADLTTTLVIEGPPVRRFSTVYDFGRGVRRSRFDLEGTLPALLATMDRDGDRAVPSA